MRSRPTHRGATGLALALALAGSVVVASVLASPVQAGAPAWRQVGKGITQGVSGLAPAPGGWVIARDNKAVGQNRIALLAPDLTVTELTWPGTAPQDLESIAAVPGSANHYVACTSSRQCFALAIAGTSLTIDRTFVLPVGGSQNESLALMTAANGQTLALWADRGSSTTTAALHAATLDVATGTFGKVKTARIGVPWPTGPVRPVSDIALVDGRILIASSSDGGASGPFNSAVYEVGTIGRNSSGATLTLHTPTELGRFPGHKIEGLACTSGQNPALLGTDDEKLGGYVASTGLC